MSALDDFSLAATRRYLQSAVFVDDKIYDQGTGMPLSAPDLPKARKPVLKPELQGGTEKEKKAEGSETTVDEQPYHPKDLVSSFAKEGIVCALYEPTEGFATSLDSEIFKLCERPDIIILDWDFSGDQGAKALDLIAALVKQSHSDFPHHIRLLAIYTADQSLVAVANKIADRLKRDKFEAEPEKSQCRLRSGATRLVIFGKHIERFGQEEKDFTVKEVDLAKRLIKEFAEMNVGLLPSYALHGLAEIRRNSKRILDRFHGGIDSAFLLQRALLKPSEEGFDQLPELLADELRAVVEDGHMPVIELEKIAAAATNGIQQTEKNLINAYDQGKSSSKLKNDLTSGGNVPACHKDIATLFGNRTQYSTHVRILRRGTIIRRRADAEKPWNYACCIVPECDCLRLDSSKKVRFPFWTLKEDAFSSGRKGRRGMVFQLSDGKYIALTAGGKATDMLWTEEFTVDATIKIVIASAKDGIFEFANSQGTIEWVGQLKPLHANRVAHDVSQGLSRVGLAEAEWLRLFCES